MNAMWKALVVSLVPSHVQLAIKLLGLGRELWMEACLSPIVPNNSWLWLLKASLMQTYTNSTT